MKSKTLTFSPIFLCGWLVGIIFLVVAVVEEKVAEVTPSESHALPLPLQ